ncbi:coenzyme F420 hydrogenase/dehydrogenase beta subunit N-terminal domain-containing protein [Streptococcus equinus]|uniref:coenzyme F420 hydrogenase/dehydrogenase beta subunit N-terminal domain-containing protein n=1 Tax=Streptococcus equinus TaxID=1335 RepID=UPI00135663DD|nr:Coenzyme F420 hydrogenase/dehydrogenase, beta subunit C-terminal domain [Streptococcus equinus]
MNTKVIIGKYKSEDVIYASSSGGAFTVLYEYAFANNYLVYGVKFDKDFKVKHSRATTIEECEEFRKSKYVLSDMKSIYHQMASDLGNGKSVLFTGTPCQCAAISNYLQLKHIETDKLLLVDLICHGAPNQRIFDEYRRENQNDKLFVGSDYKGTDRFKAYEKYFEDKGVEIVYFPYTKGTSSTQLRQLIADENKRM